MMKPQHRHKPLGASQANDLLNAQGRVWSGEVETTIASHKPSTSRTPGVAVTPGYVKFKHIHKKYCPNLVLPVALNSTVRTASSSVVRGGAAEEHGFHGSGYET
uniref:Uncharacterized protein n=1 Tax=Anopheles merus TaxID=30066 RepID=A0A182V404_ANOME